MRFHIISLFPSAFDSYLGESILKRAIEDGKIAVRFYNPRDFAAGNSGRAVRVDKRPYGGGPGMVIEALPVVKAVEKALAAVKKNKKAREKIKTKIIWLAPGAKQFDTEYAGATAQKYTDIIIICGRYEGIDARVKKIFKCEEISIGPFVLTGGELPAMLIIDCVSRQVSGVLGDFNSLEESRVASHDVYTRPEKLVYKGKKYNVPPILLSGHQAKIEEWKQKQG